MCLLIQGKSNAVRSTLLNTAGLIEDIYAGNEDGLGLMFVDSGEVRTVKALPKNVQEARDVIAKMPQDDREVAAHWRMRTHGATDLDNCHPYTVNKGSWLMHNGILHTGNTADRSKSDTWHFVQDYLQALDDDVLHNPGILSMMEEFIGNNRFAILSPDGRMAVVNREQGIEHDGVWYSNTYAWDASILVPSYAKRRPVSQLYIGTKSGGWGSVYGYAGSSKRAADAALAWPVADAEDDEPRMEPYDMLAESIDAAIYDLDETTMHACITQDITGTVDYILDNYDIREYSRFDPKDYPTEYCAAVAAWADKDRAALVSMDAIVLSQSLCYSIDLDSLFDADEEYVAAYERAYAS